MKSTIAVAALLVLALCTPLWSKAPTSKPVDLWVPSVLSDGMVVQQQKPITVWGRAEPGSVVSSRFHKSSDIAIVAAAKTLTDSTGHWAIELPQMPASFTAYTIEIDNGKTHLLIRNVLVGEVWVAAGQSNMQLSIPYVIGGSDLLAKADQPNIRIFNQDHIPAPIQGNYSANPLEDVSGGLWQMADSKASLLKKDVSAIAYTFALELFDSLNTGGRQVPVAVLNTATGATSIQAWLSREEIHGDPLLISRYPKAWKRGTADQAFNQATAEYNHKIAPLTHLAVRGFIWSQGENDVGGADAADYYRRALRVLIQQWRKDFHSPDAAFIAAQLHPFLHYEDLTTTAGMREAQIEACEAASNAVAIPIHDISLEWNTGPFKYKSPIHPLDKAPVGRRMARSAEAIAYQQPVEYRGPVFKAMEVKNQVAVLTFTHAEGLQTKPNGATLKGLTLCGADRVFFPAEAKIAGQTVELSSLAVPVPVAATFGYTSLNQACNLFNSQGLPADPFRTDKIASHYFDPQPWMDCDSLKFWMFKIQGPHATKVAEWASCWDAAPAVAMGDPKFTLDTTASPAGKPSLRIDYTATAADAYRVAFSPALQQKLDWVPYKNLKFQIYNPRKSEIAISIQLKTPAGKTVLITCQNSAGETGCAVAPGWSTITASADGSLGEIAQMIFTLQCRSPASGAEDRGYILLSDFQLR